MNLHDKLLHHVELMRSVDIPEDATTHYAGFFDLRRKATLQRLFQGFTRRYKEPPKVIVELGSLVGRSTRFFLNELPDCTVIAVDWFESPPEGHSLWKLESFVTLRDLCGGDFYKQFLINMQPWRARVIPMKCTTVEALQELQRLSVVPDVVYVDASHDFDSAHSDISKSLDLQPRLIVGDDWPWYPPGLSSRPVARAVEHVFRFRFMHEQLHELPSFSVLHPLWWAWPLEKDAL